MLQPEEKLGGSKGHVSLEGWAGVTQKGREAACTQADRRRFMATPKF